MSRSNLEDKIFDTILKQAFADENERAMSQVSINDEFLSGYTPSYKHNRVMKKIMRNHSRSFVSVSKKIQRIAVVLLVAIGIGAGIMSLSPNVRAAYRQAVIQWFEKYAVFEFKTGSGSFVAGEYKMTYLPDGFTIIDSMESRSASSFQFEDDKNHYIHFSYMQRNLTTIMTDNERMVYTPMEINGNEAYLLESAEDVMVMWADENIVFTLNSNIRSNELIKIAENIKIID